MTPRVLLLAALIHAGAGWAMAQPAEVRDAVPQAQLVGSGRLTVWGFDAYDAALWAPPGFQSAPYAGQTFALELVYLRDFTGEAIADRSIREMRRIGSVSEAQAAEWLRAMRSAFPDIRRGDRISGVNLPGGLVRFFTNGRLTGELRDETFARLFFGIWLAPQTSEPGLRRALLASVPPPSGTPVTRTP